MAPSRCRPPCEATRGRRPVRASWPPLSLPGGGASHCRFGAPSALAGTERRALAKRLRHLIRAWANAVELAPNWPTSAPPFHSRRRSKSGRCGAKFGRKGPISAECWGPNRSKSKILHHTWPSSARFGPTPDKVGVEFIIGRFQPNSGRFWANVGRCRSRLPRIRSDSSQLRPSSARVRPSSARSRTNVREIGKGCPDLGKVPKMCAVPRSGT